MSTSPRALRRRGVAGVLAGALLFAACGGNGSDSAGSDAEASSGTEAPAPPDEVEVDPTADTAANQLPDVVVDDLQVGNKVNLRNFAPSDTPILLWMWAPH